MFKLTNTTSILRKSDGACIPADPENIDFQQYQAWLFAGNEPEPADVPVVTPRDLLAKLDAENALTQRNLRETILLMAEAFKVVSNNAVDLSQIPGVAKVAEVEAQAAALRAQL